MILRLEYNFPTFDSIYFFCVMYYIQFFFLLPSNYFNQLFLINLLFKFLELFFLTLCLFFQVHIPLDLKQLPFAFIFVLSLLLFFL